MLPLALCCMLPMLFRGGQGQGQEAQVTAEFDAWTVSYGIQEAYDAIVEEVEDWREKAARRKKSRFSFLTRRQPQYFEVDQAVPPRLYRLLDDKAGEITFELTEVENGGTSIKSSYESRARAIIQDFKAKLPIKVGAQKICPVCSKPMQPDFSTCPYCGTQLAS